MRYAFVFIALSWVCLLLAAFGIVVLPDSWQDTWHKCTIGGGLLCAIVAISLFIAWFLFA